MILKLEDDTAEYYSRASTTISIYTTSCEILWSKNIEKRQKYTFANKLNNYSREADKQKEAFSRYFVVIYILYKFIIDVWLSWLNYNSIIMTLNKLNIRSLKKWSPRVIDTLLSLIYKVREPVVKNIQNIRDILSDRGKAQIPK